MKLMFIVDFLSFGVSTQYICKKSETSPHFLKLFFESCFGEDFLQDENVFSVKRTCRNVEHLTYLIDRISVHQQSAAEIKECECKDAVASLVKKTNEILTALRAVGIIATE